MNISGASATSILFFFLSTALFTNIFSQDERTVVTAIMSFATAVKSNTSVNSQEIRSLARGDSIDVIDIVGSYAVVSIGDSLGYVPIAFLAKNPAIEKWKSELEQAGLDKQLQDYLAESAQKKLERMPDNCSQMLIEQVDRFTGGYSLRSKGNLTLTDNSHPAFRANAMIVRAKRSEDAKNSQILISLSFSGYPTCIEKHTELSLLFEDNSVSRIENLEDYNCDALFIAHLNWDSEAVESLTSKNLIAVRLTTVRKTFESDIPTAQAKALRDYVACLTYWSGN